MLICLMYETTQPSNEWNRHTHPFDYKRSDSQQRSTADS